MSAFTEFLLVAAVIYLWESTLWLPLRSMVLRRGFFGGKWRTVRPDQWMSTKDLGLVPMLPAITDTGLAPCQAPPLLADGTGNLFAEIPGSEPAPCGTAGWDDLTGTFPLLSVSGATVRISSPRVLDLLRRARSRGDSPAEAVRKWWSLSLSPDRADREWKRWRKVSFPLEIPCQLLTFGFFAGLPLAFVHFGALAALAVAGALWLLMLVIAARLWWIGSRVYPTVKPQFRMDAALAALVPFHAMRAVEIASVHVFSLTHPAALLLANGQTDDRWLASFVREILHPRPGKPGDPARIRMISPALEKSLARIGKNPRDYDTVPDRSEDPEAAAYCPRCHSLFSPGTGSCTDCRGIPLLPFDR